jgi:hypothetical protein
MPLVDPSLSTNDWEDLEDQLAIIFDLWISYFNKIAVFRPRLAIRAIAVHRVLCHLDWILRQQNREDRNSAKKLEDLQDINNFFIDN